MFIASFYKYILVYIREYIRVLGHTFSLTSAREVFGRIIVGEDPSDSKSNRLHVDILRF